MEFLGKAVLLSRYKEHVMFVLPLTLLGILLAGADGYTPINWRVVPVLLANILSVSYAFMINELEDAGDDAKNKEAQKRNPIASRRISKKLGFKITKLTATLVFFFYLLAGFRVFLVGCTILVLSHLYSWKRIRLKARPGVDIISHSLMLGGLLILAGFLTYSTNVKSIWPIIVSVTLFSAYGQLYNQLRDFGVDSKVGLQTTSITLGEKKAKRLMYIMICLAIATLGKGIYIGLFPAWLLVPFIFSIPVSFIVSGRSDARGSRALEFTGSLQYQTLVIFTITMSAWFLYSVYITLLSPFFKL